MKTFTPYEVERARIRLHFSQERMANEIGTSLQNYKRWMSGDWFSPIRQMNVYRARIADLCQKSNDGRWDNDDEIDEPPTDTPYIGDGGYLMTWDGEQWRNDGPVSDAVMVCLRMIRSLTDRIAALEGKLR